MSLSRALAGAVVFLLGFQAAAPMGPQEAKAPLAFEVASVKPSRPGPNGVNGSCHGIDSVYTPGQKAGAPPLGRCVITDARLSHLVSIAWDIGTMQMIQSGPDWIARGMERFDVVAKAEDPGKTTEQQLLTMLQTMIVERFQMKYHRVPTETPGFALTIAKNGPRLNPSRTEDADLSLGGPGAARGKPGPGEPVSIRVRRYSMAMLVKFLSTFGGQGPGIDKTGLDGLYDFTLSWDEDAGPTLATALREQMGLRMEPQKVPISNFVIDSAQRPSAN
jgi:uncharacterized protein (TIGR03435 family)